MQANWKVMNEFTKRTLSGAVYVACVVGSILWRPSVFAILFGIICLLAVDEFHRLVKSPRMLRIGAFFATATLWSFSQWYILLPPVEIDTWEWTLCFIIAYGSILIIWLLDEIWNHSGRPIESWGHLLGSQLMIAFPMCTMTFLLHLDKWLLLALFVLIWVNDSGAYCVGSLTAKLPKGNHKMAPHVSPKKSWEGLIGGFVFTFIAAIILAKCGWFDTIVTPRIIWIVAILFAFFVSTFGTMGDLMESLMKRSLGVKDSGIFLPGHGGVLDRFDSILLAAPVLTAFSWVCYFLLPLL